MTACLPTRSVEKPWGRMGLPQAFGGIDGKQIGEVWFEPPSDQAELLIKYIFTTEKLSVQVHPSDNQTLGQGLGRQGKEECWLVIDAVPGATLGIGFNEVMDADQMRAAALDGSIEHLMTWHSVSVGDFFYIPANTVHAIGAGISLIEVQQNSDITYRLYDYGRLRELHLDQGIAVARGEVYNAALAKHVPLTSNTALVDGPYFRLDQVVGQPDERLRSRYSAGPFFVIPRSDETPVLVKGETVAVGQCARVETIEDVEIQPEGSCLFAQAIK
ncbi:class I mannose-6-phosphate isomerase [Sphingobium limneticum]|jgi:mannose-6-phosphate isomerase|uniref:class I mannose-6-phosphate isomerase n=1 Tax=Sphingobium TaxID=165695 RepID=UPI00313793CF